MGARRASGRHVDPLGLRAEREKLALTQKELAQGLGVCVDSIVNWEKGHYPPQMRYRKKYAQRLGLTLEELQQRLGGVP